MTWGYELIIDAAGCNDSVKSPIVIKEFAKAMVEALDMKPYGEPQVVHFGNDYLEGNTLVQLIHTSNITAHFNDIDNSCYLNIFSCKAFDRNAAIHCFGSFFNPSGMTTRLLERQA